MLTTPILTSSALPPCPSHPTAFNNLAIQYALVGNLPPDSDLSFWVLPPLKTDGSAVGA
ncbi:hypothetical protein QCA50_002815 [Cerrena zonata]|uniref:Uncharacterized protein n=1 Tax=Cerrena zonata TaxID=2478898 RepID=A0AAW0GUV7_9APHY